MALVTYSDLQSSIADWLGRSDLTAVIPDFITLAEARLNRALRAQEMIATVTTGLVSNATVPLPADYIEWISVRWIGAVRTQDLAYVEADSPEWRFRFRPNSDPQMFAILAGNFEIRPTAAGSLKQYYYQKIPALTASNTTNWVITKVPDLYLFTSMAEAHIYMKDEARAAEFLTLAKQEADGQSIAADASKFKIEPTRVVDTNAGVIRGGAA